MARARAGMGVDWEAVFRAAESVTGSHRARYNAVVAASEAGVLLGPIPTYNGFWRRDTGARGSTSSTPGLPSLEQGSKLTREKEVQPHVMARDRLYRAAAALRAAGELNDSDANSIKLAIKPASASRVSRLEAERVSAVIARMEMLSERLESRLPTAPTQTPPAIESAPVTIHAQRIVDPVTSSRADVALSDGTIGGGISFGMVVGHERVPAAICLARLRARIIAPVLGGAITPVECVEMVRAAASGLRTAQIADVYGELPHSDVKRYASFNVRTVRRWIKQIVSSQKQDAAAGVARKTVDEYLRHRYPAGVTRHRKVLPEHKEWIKDRYVDQPNASMADVARDLRSEMGLAVSFRHVQRVLSTELVDVERSDGRAGVLADVLFRSKLLREAPYANYCWIGDHSFVNFDHLDSAQPGESKRLTSFDLEFEVAVEDRRRHGVLKRNRSQVCITRWIDACTRFTVGITVWLSPPNAIQTLGSLFLACLRHGVPERIYTDNGTDFRSNLVQDAVANAGIQHAFSRPATPEGRGKLERSFRTLKAVLARWPGALCGRHPVHWGSEQLLTPGELENALVRHVAMEEASVPNRSTGLPPAVHFERAVGARAMNSSSPEAIARLLTLLPREERQRHVFGVEAGNLPYWAPALKMVPIGARVFVQSVPNIHEYRYLSVPAADGSIRYLARASVYDVDHPPPDLAEAARLEREFDEHLTQVTDRAQRSGETEQRNRMAVEQGEALAASMPVLPVAAASILAPQQRKAPVRVRRGKQQSEPIVGEIGDLPDPFA